MHVTWGPKAGGVGLEVRPTIALTPAGLGPSPEVDPRHPTEYLAHPPPPRLLGFFDALTQLLHRPQPLKLLP